MTKPSMNFIKAAFIMFTNAFNAGADASDMAREFLTEAKPGAASLGRATAKTAGLLEDLADIGTEATERYKNDLRSEQQRLELAATELLGTSKPVATFDIEQA